MDVKDSESLSYSDPHTLENLFRCGEKASYWNNYNNYSSKMYIMLWEHRRKSYLIFPDVDYRL